MNCDTVADGETRGWQRCIHCGTRFAVAWPTRIVATCRAVGQPGDLMRPPPGGCCDPPPIDAAGNVLAE